MIEVEGTGFVSFPVTDLERSLQFYCETLGIPRNTHGPSSNPELESGNLTLSLDPQSEALVASASSIALRVPDVDAARHELEQAGVAFDGETFDTGVCHVAFFTDPDGNRLMLRRRYAPAGTGGS